MGELITFIFVIWIIVWIISSLVKGVSKVTKQVSIRRSIDKTKTLQERNQDIIDESYKEIRKDSWSYYIENKTRDCLKKIAEREGEASYAPGSREWLPQWQQRAGIPKDYLELKDYILQRFKSRYQEIIDKEKKQEDRKYQNIIENSKDLIDKFLEITERKVSILDDYGDENWSALAKEIENCINKIAGKYNSVSYDYSFRSSLKEELEKRFRNYHRSRKNKKVPDENLGELSGVEFEVYIARILKDNGYDVSGTPATGDQGADLVARKDGKTIIIQAKRYQGTVGNKAVQEVTGAVNFYSGDEGWVITNSTFTPSAKALAQKNNIKLIDGHDLARIKDFLN